MLYIKVYQCDGKNTCLEPQCAFKYPHTLRLEDDPGSCYHDKHSDNQHHECDPHVPITETLCNQTT